VDAREVVVDAPQQVVGEAVGHGGPVPLGDARQLERPDHEDDPTAADRAGAVVVRLERLDRGDELGRGRGLFGAGQGRGYEVRLAPQDVCDHEVVVLEGGRADDVDAGSEPGVVVPQVDGGVRVRHDQRGVAGERRGVGCVVRAGGRGEAQPSQPPGGGAREISVGQVDQDGRQCTAHGVLFVSVPSGIARR